jgi:hypothetical protein
MRVHQEVHGDEFAKRDRTCSVARILKNTTALRGGVTHYQIEVYTACVI